jgi:hypothetical protein
MIYKDNVDNRLFLLIKLISATQNQIAQHQSNWQIVLVHQHTLDTHAQTKKRLLLLHSYKHHKN